MKNLKVGQYISLANCNGSGYTFTNKETCVGQIKEVRESGYVVIDILNDRAFKSSLTWFFKRSFLEDCKILRKNSKLLKGLIGDQG